MRGVMGAADRAVFMTRALLTELSPGCLVHDVQADPRFQHRGVDLLWDRPGEGVLGVEVKGDRNAHRGNYFFELVSNLEKDTPGCFLYSEADLMVYAFLATQEVHVLPLPKVRAWFLAEAARYPLRHTRTRTGKVLYTTVGALVPVKDVLAAGLGVERHRRTPPRRAARPEPAAR